MAGSSPVTLDDPNDDDDAYYESCSLLSSVSTNATADDLEGPGRALWKLFDYAGAHLEKGLTNLVPQLRHMGKKRRDETDDRSGSRAHEEDADSNYRFEQCSLVDSISTNATADDLPGHGRLIGLFYASAGKRLELQVGRVAEKLGKGPNMASARIERRREKMAHLELGSEKLLKKDAKVKKDIVKLLKYTQSQTTSTQIKALEKIATLAIEDPFVRNVLLLINARSYIEPLQRLSPRPTKYSPALLGRSRRALLSFTETEVIGLAERIEGMVMTAMLAWPTSQILRLKSYLSDSDRAFLVLRFLRRILDRTCSSENAFDQIVVHEVLDFGDLSRNWFNYNFDWSDLDEIISRHLQIILDHGSFYSGLLTKDTVPKLEMIIRHAEHLPKTIGSNFFAWFSSYKTEGDLHLHLSWCLLQGIMIANSFEDWCTIRGKLQFLESRYSHPAIQPLLQRMTCPSELLLLDVFATRHNLLETWTSARSGDTRVLDFDRLENICRALRHFLESDSLIRERAIVALKYLLTADVYCRRKALNVLSEAPILHGISSKLLAEAIEMDCAPRDTSKDLSNHTIEITRHCGEDGKLLHLNVTQGFFRQEPASCCDAADGSQQVLRFPCGDVQELVIPRGKPFITEGYYPLSAGITSNGNRAYIALPMTENRYSDRYIAITEGMRPDDLLMWDRPRFASGKRQKVTPLYLTVYVLRYAPEAYKQCIRFSDPPSEYGPKFHAAGPYYWSPWQDNSDADSDIMTPEQLLEWFEQDSDGE